MITGLVHFMTAPAVMASLIAAAVATLGLFTVWLKTDWAQTHASKFTAFAAGILVTTAIMMLPDAFAGTSKAVYGVLGGYLFLYFINTLTYRHEHAMSYLAPVIAIAFHSFVDGFGYGIVFEISTMTGIIASMGLIAHEFAEAVILFAILRGSNVPMRTALVVAFIASAVTTIGGAIGSQYALPIISTELLALMISGAAGAILYVGSTHLTGHLRSADKRRTIPLYIVGVVLALMINQAHHISGHDTYEHDVHLSDHD